MAAKAPAKPKAKSSKAVKTSKSSASKAKYTSAQYSAYQKASKSAVAHAQLLHSARILQQRRLQAAVKTRSKLSAKGAQAMAARIKAHAVRQTYLQIVSAKQSSTLRIATAHRLFRAQSVATQKQFAYKGEAIHARTTSLQTLTNQQALTAAESLAAKARKSLRKPPRVVGNASGKKKGATRRSGYTAIGAAAGRAAAARVPPAAKTRTAALHREVTFEDVEWVTAGNDQDQENCVAVALANHLLYHTGVKIPDSAVEYLTTYNTTDFARALRLIDYGSVWDSWHVELSEYGMLPVDKAEPGTCVGFDVQAGGKTQAHCGLLLEGGKVVSWGEIIPVPGEIDEVWEATWKTRNLA